MNVEILKPYAIGLGVFVGTIILAYIVNRLLTRLINRSTTIIKNDPTSYKFFKHIIVGAIYIIGFGVAVYTIPGLKSLATSMLAGAGILAVAVGFAAQSALSNVISGMFLIVFRPFKVNDRLVIRTFTGIVEEITLRHTIIRDFENKRIIIPNSVISDEIIINADFADEKICRFIDIGISYSSDVELAKAIIAEEILKHPLHLDPRTPEDIEAGKPEAVVRVIALQDSAVQLRGWSWAVDAANAFVMSCDLLESIKKRFDSEGIEIPFPHRTVYMRTDNKENTIESNSDTTPQR